MISHKNTPQIPLKSLGNFSEMMSQVILHTTYSFKQRERNKHTHKYHWLYIYIYIYIYRSP